MRYAVEAVPDDHEALRTVLQKIADEGGRVVAVLWQPNRQTGVKYRFDDSRSGYTVISEHE